MTAATDIAELAHDLGCKLGSELVPRLEQVDSVDDQLEFAPTAADFRRAAARLPLMAVYFAGPMFPVHIGVGVNISEVEPVVIGVTANPRDIKAAAQQWNWLDIVMHGLVWVEGPTREEARRRAESLRDQIHDALDYRKVHRLKRFWLLPPPKVMELSLAVARAANLPVFDEGERQRRLERMVADGARRIRRR